MEGLKPLKDNLLRSFAMRTKMVIALVMALVMVSASRAGIITVASPNGGEVWKMGETHRVTWTSEGVDTVAIYVYNDTIFGSGSTNYLDSAGTSLSVPASQGYFDWTLVNWVPQPALENNNRFKIRIDGGGTSDRSDDYFTILRPYSIISSPCGGETWNIGETHEIKWEHEGFVRLQIELWRLGSYPGETIAWQVDPDAGSYSWTLSPNATPLLQDGGQFKISIVGFDETGKHFRDYSGDFFTVVPEPGSIVLLLTALAFGGVMIVRRKLMG